MHYIKAHKGKMSKIMWRNFGWIRPEKIRWFLHHPPENHLPRLRLLRLRRLVLLLFLCFWPEPLLLSLLCRFSSSSLELMDSEESFFGCFCLYFSANWTSGSSISSTPTMNFRGTLYFFLISAHMYLFIKITKQSQFDKSIEKAFFSLVCICKYHWDFP